MVRNYVRKKNRKSWDESSMLLAIKAVIDDKNSYNKALQQPLTMCPIRHCKIELEKLKMEK